MAGKIVIAICQSGGEFETDKDGVLSYKGGEAHAMDIDDKMKYKDFKVEVAEMFSCNVGTMVIKYFLPSNKKTLITVSNDKDLKRMIKFHSDSDTAEIFVITEVAVPETSHMPGSSASRTAVSESAAVPIESAPDFMMEDVPDVVDVANVADVGADSNQDALVLDTSFDIVGDTNHGDLDLDIPVDITDADDGSAYEEKISKATDIWKNNITEVGQRFNSVHEFREALRKYAIAHHFSFKYKKNDSHRVTVKCKEEGCPWRIHASRLSTTQLISIKKMNADHKCDRGSLSNGYQATRSWVASIIKEKLRSDPSYKPKDIVKDIKKEYGIQLNYFQAWRGKEIAKEQIQGSYKEAYRQLPYLCEKIMETNPGSLATFTTKENNSFHRLFVAFHASLHGFEHGCRPLLFLDSLLLRSKYQGTLLTATAPDGNDDVFPVAFAVVDTESDDNWLWFLMQLKTALSTYRSVPMVEGEALVGNALPSVSRIITFVADREKGLKESIAQVFPNGEAFHAYCLRYLSEQLLRDLKCQYSHEVKRVMAADLFTTAFATSPERFQECAEGMKRISLEAFEFLMRNEPEHWANAFFGGARYNHMVSKFGEPFFSWVADASELPITQLVDTLRGKMIELFDSRRAAFETWETRLTPSKELMIANETERTVGLTVYYHGSSCEVHVGENIFEVVDLDSGKCSCKLWQITGLPCCHALAVMNYMQRDPYVFCSEWFTRTTYAQTYSETIEPLPIIERERKRDTSLSAVTVTPPPTRRPPGRPTTKKIAQESMKRQLQCSNCKGTGHNKSTCKENKEEFMLDNLGV